MWTVPREHGSYTLQHSGRDLAGAAVLDALDQGHDFARLDLVNRAGLPIKDGDRAHIDVGTGPAEFSVQIQRTELVVAVFAPFALAELEQGAASRD